MSFSRRTPLFVATIVLIGVGSVLVWRTVYSVSGPTTEDYRVYAAFVKRLAADNGWATNDVLLASPTSTLSEPRFEDWVPPGLQPGPPSKWIAPDYFVAFCGNTCGRDFMKKNLVAWQVEPGPASEFRVEIIPALGKAPNQRVVIVTRAGFDLWHRRAVLKYSVDCDHGTGDVPIVCVEFGQAFLQKINGTWKVQKVSAVTF